MYSYIVFFWQASNCDMFYHDHMSTQIFFPDLMFYLSTFVRLKTAIKRPLLFFSKTIQ